MNAITKSIDVNVGPDRAYEALTRFEAYRGWWSRNSAVPAHVGGEALLHFVKDDQPVAMRFRIEELDREKRVVWHCVANDAPPWVGTALTWSLSGTGTGTRIDLKHDGWKLPAPPPVADGWDHFTSSLKSYLETGSGQPW